MKLHFPLNEITLSHRIVSLYRFRFILFSLVIVRVHYLHFTGVHPLAECALCTPYLIAVRIHREGGQFTFTCIYIYTVQRAQLDKSLFLCQFDYNSAKDFSLFGRLLCFTCRMAEWLLLALPRIITVFVRSSFRHLWPIAFLQNFH